MNDMLSCACFYFNVDKKSTGFGECETATIEDSVKWNAQVMELMILPEMAIFQEWQSEE